MLKQLFSVVLSSFVALMAIAAGWIDLERRTTAAEQTAAKAEKRIDRLEDKFDRWAERGHE